MKEILGKLKIDKIYISALTTAYSSLKEQYAKDDFEKNYADCFYAIGTMLHWCLMSLNDYMMTSQNIVSLDLLITS